jgi:SAM-dependent methyltransferase
VARWFDRGPKSVLELGGGLASGTLALLERLEEAGRLGGLARYRFTEAAPPFLRRGQRTLAARYPGAPWLATSRLDMNEPFAGQGIEPGAYDLVYAVNTVHVATDLAFTLKEIRAALAPGGRVVLSECVRPFAGQAVHVEFVFNLLDAFTSPAVTAPYRRRGGFLTPEEWGAALHVAGFDGIELYPDVARIRETYRSFFVAAVGATSAADSAMPC